MRVKLLQFAKININKKNRNTQYEIPSNNIN